VRVPSASSLPLVSVCAPSAVLPAVRHVNHQSVMGDALHDHMRDRSALGIDEAMRRIGDLAKRYNLDEREAGIFAARCRSFEWVPPGGSFGEVGLCLREDGSVVRVKGSKGQYEMPDDAVTAGTLDVFWAEPTPLDLSDPAHPRCHPGSVLWVVDYKSGDDSYVHPVESNAQLAAQAVLAARFTGATQVVPAILFIRKGQGEWDAPDAAWGPKRLEAAEKQIRETVNRVRLEKAALDRGDPLHLVEGPHCEWCPAKTRCPAHTGIFKQILAGSVPWGDAPLSAEERVWLAERLSMIESIGKKGRALLRADVDVNGPVSLSDGNIWGPVPGKQTQIVGKVALPILQESLGELAEQAVETNVTRESVERAVKAFCEAAGIERGVAPRVRQIMAKLGEAGALLDVPRVEYRAHKPERAA
jgi:hypothetical protein